MEHRHGGRGQAGAIAPTRRKFCAASSLFYRLRILPNTVPLLLLDRFQTRLQRGTHFAGGSVATCRSGSAGFQDDHVQH